MLPNNKINVLAGLLPSRTYSLSNGFIDDDKQPALLDLPDNPSGLVHQFETQDMRLAACGKHRCLCYLLMFMHLAFKYQTTPKLCLHIFFQNIASLIHDYFLSIYFSHFPCAIIFVFFGPKCRKLMSYRPLPMSLYL